MGTSIRCQSPHEADTKTTVGRGPGAGRGRRVRAEETLQSLRQPRSLALFSFYTLFERFPALTQEVHSHPK